MDDWPFVRFVFLLYVPVYPRHHAAGKKGRLSDSAGGAAAMSAGVVTHMATFVTCILLLAQRAYPLPAVMRYYACGELVERWMDMDGWIEIFEERERGIKGGESAED